MDCILLSCRHHVRDSLEAAERFGATVQAPRTGMDDFGDDTPIRPYDFGDPMLGRGVTAHQVGGLSPDETALHIPAHRAVAVADGVVRVPSDGPLRFVADALMYDPARTKAGLAAAYRRVLERDWDTLLLAHGHPLVGDGRAELTRFLEASGG